MTVLADGYAIGPEDAERGLVFYPGGRHAGFGDYGPHPETEIRPLPLWNRWRSLLNLLRAEEQPRRNRLEFPETECDTDAARRACVRVHVWGGISRAKDEG